MTICPYDCSPCGDALCRGEGCRLATEMVSLVCDGCGEPVSGVNCLELCMMCSLAPGEELSSVPRKVPHTR